MQYFDTPRDLRERITELEAMLDWALAHIDRLQTQLDAKEELIGTLRTRHRNEHAAQRDLARLLRGS